MLKQIGRLYVIIDNNKKNLKPAMKAFYISGMYSFVGKGNTVFLLGLKINCFDNWVFCTPLLFQQDDLKRDT